MSASPTASIHVDEDHPLRVVVCDGHVLVAHSLARFLNHLGGIEVVGTAATGGEVLELAREQTPDVALVDTGIERPRADAVTPRLTELGVRVVWLSSEAGHVEAVEAVRAGALGYVSKRDSGGRLLSALRRVAANEADVPPEYLTGVLTTLAAPAPVHVDPLERLTPRQREVLELLSAGEGIADVARELYLSVLTVRGHIRGILTTLGVRSVAQAVAIALGGRIAVATV